MEDHDNKQKSPHLQQLEEAFEKRTRRFSAFEILGLTPEGGQKSPEVQRLSSGPSNPPSVSDGPPHGSNEHTQGSISELNRPNTAMGVSDKPSHGSVQHTPGMAVANTLPHGSDTPTLARQSIASDIASGSIDAPEELPPGSYRHTHGGVRPTPGVSPHDQVVVVVNKTTTAEKPIPGMGVAETARSGGAGHPQGSARYRAVVAKHSYGSNEPPVSAHLDPGADADKADHRAERPATQVRGLPLADVVTAMRLGGQLGKKACQVLAYLNTMRSPNHESYTIPVGYGQISGAAGIDAHYLRRKVLPKLAMLGLIGVARKSLDGTIYHFLHGPDFVSVVTGELTVEQARTVADEAVDLPEAGDNATALPEWIERERWGWLSPESVRRLVQKAGSEELASEKLEMILYNETHGPPERRVRNRRSVLAYYLSSPQAEIWPNDDGFETLEMRRVIWERERARREKALAEEALQARQEAEQAKFVAALAEGQLRWIKREAKRRVDAKPAANFLQSRYPLYKAEEEQLIQEWRDRAGYGECVPVAQEEPIE